MLCAALALVPILAGPISVASLRDLRVVTVDLNDPTIVVDVSVAPQFPGGDETFGQLIRQSGAIAAINGAYFSRTTKLPIGDLVRRGEVIHQGRMGTAFVFGRDRKATIDRVVRHKTQDWSAAETVLACGPMLVRDGKVDVRYQEEGFRDPVAIAAVPRQTIGLTASGKLLLVAMRRARSWTQAGEEMVRLGCISAMNLDSGASAALYAEGKMLVSAGRRLPAALIIRRQTR
jgi:exopolysaccharide biosynthesis protein